MKKEPYPILLNPCYMNYLWGGERIPLKFERTIEVKPCAESWEASDRLEASNVIQNGFLKQKTLREAFKEQSFISNSSCFSRLPFLIKLIDARKALSIQVHPSEEKAEILSGEPKTEAWHILDAEPNSRIYLGLKEKLSLKEIELAIHNQTLENYLNPIPVKKGQTFFIPAGLIHSIGAGCLIYEVQQNSNTTYRLYDWNRVDSQGKKRELHLRTGLKALKEDQGTQKPCIRENIETSEGKKEKLVSCSYFNLLFWSFSEERHLYPCTHFRHFFLREGTCKLIYNQDEIVMKKGQSVLIPPKCSLFSLIPLSASCQVMESTA